MAVARQEAEVKYAGTAVVAANINSSKI